MFIPLWSKHPHVVALLLRKDWKKGGKPAPSSLQMLVQYKLKLFYIIFESDIQTKQLKLFLICLDPKADSKGPIRCGLLCSVRCLLLLILERKSMQLNSALCCSLSHHSSACVNAHSRHEWSAWFLRPVVNCSEWRSAATLSLFVCVGLLASLWACRFSSGPIGWLTQYQGCLENLRNPNPTNSLCKRTYNL